MISGCLNISLYLCTVYAAADTALGPGWGSGSRGSRVTHSLGASLEMSNEAPGSCRALPGTLPKYPGTDAIFEVQLKGRLVAPT